MNEKRGFVTPHCCAEAQDARPIVLTLDVYDSGPSDAQTPEWTYKMFDHEGWRQRHTHAVPKEEVEAGIVTNEHGVQQMTVPYTRTDKTPDPKFCPFCGTALPAPVRREPAPKVCVVTDGGYYCDTCSERLNCCECLMPEQAWEPGPGGVR